MTVPTPAGGMAVVPGIDALEPSLGRLFVVVGVFDGLHRGHLYLLEELARAASARSSRPAVVTFDHHPDEILVGAAPPLLCDPQERLERLAAAGVEATVVQTFDLALRMTTYDAFIRRIADRVDLAGLLMTPDSSFGYQRGGTPETVAALGRQMGYDVAVVPPFELDGQPVKSSDIRAAIAAGDLATAERLLGRPVSITGTAVPAIDGPGATLAFDLPVALPPPGRYEARIAGPGGNTVGAEVRIDEAGVGVSSPLPILGRVSLELVASGPLEPGVVTASSGSPDRVAPDEVTPDHVAPDRVAPDRLAPGDATDG